MPVKLCPVCGVELRARIVYEIETDYCLRCGGVWLDGGELNKLLEKIKEYRSSYEYEDRDDDYEERYSDDERGRKRKKRSVFEFFEDIFDFG